MNNNNLDDMCVLTPFCAPIDKDCLVILIAILVKKDSGDIAEFSNYELSKVIGRSQKRVERCVKKLVTGGYITKEPCGDGLRDTYDIGEAIWNYNDVAKKCLDEIKSVLGEDDETMYSEENDGQWIQN